MENMSDWESKICSHCGYPIGFRKISDKCDHLYYPDNCKICENTPKEKRTKVYIKEEDFKV
jgi:hypothetical protein